MTPIGSASPSGRSRSFLKAMAESFGQSFALAVRHRMSPLFCMALAIWYVGGYPDCRATVGTVYGLFTLAASIAVLTSATRTWVRHREHRRFRCITTDGAWALALHHPRRSSCCRPAVKADAAAGCSTARCFWPASCALRWLFLKITYAAALAPAAGCLSLAASVRAAARWLDRLQLFGAVLAARSRLSWSSGYGIGVSFRLSTVIFGRHQAAPLNAMRPFVGWSLQALSSCRPAHILAPTLVVLLRHRASICGADRSAGSLESLLVSGASA